MQYKNFVAIITGGGTGVGAAAALMLAKGGAKIAINYSRSEEAAQTTAAACEELGGQTLVVQGDVSKDEDCRAIVAATIDKWGRVDGLMNNAGMTQFNNDNSLDALTAEMFQRIYSVNVVGAYQMTRAVAPQMQEQGEGSIVNTSSIAGVMGVGSSMAYAASKGAMNTMTLSLARYLAPQIRVNAIAPGFITGRWWLDELGQEGYEKMVTSVEKSVPLEHAGTPEDMAEAALFFLTGARNITGEILISDAGMHLGGAPLKAR